MASATFGRKGVEPGAAEPVRRRATFLTPPAAAPAPESSDPLAKARDAFLASERARARDADDGGASDSPAAVRAGRTVVVSGKSLGTAYVLWFFLGGFSAHRFYLGTPFTAIAQVCLWYISLMMLMVGNSIAFYPLTAGGLWILADAFLMSRLRDAANEKLRRRAETLQPEPLEALSP